MNKYLFVVGPTCSGKNDYAYELSKLIDIEIINADAGLEGRIGKDNFTSLNGSLAPANTINNIVREIPVVGKILTGKKGDGIFGASFKIKGKNNFKVEVNPIKTLTPRFIQRFLKIFKK